MSAGTVLRWEAPPPARRRRVSEVAADHDAIAAALRARPGRWAVIASGSVQTGLVAQIRRGAMPAYQPTGAYEAVRRTVEGRVVVYARFVGDEGVSSC